MHVIPPVILRTSWIARPHCEFWVWLRFPVSVNKGRVVPRISLASLRTHTHVHLHLLLTRPYSESMHMHTSCTANERRKKNLRLALWIWTLLASIYKLPLKIKQWNPGATNPIPSREGNVFLTYRISQESVRKCSVNQHLMFPILLREFTSDWGAGSLMSLKYWQQLIQLMCFLALSFRLFLRTQYM